MFQQGRRADFGEFGESLRQTVPHIDHSAERKSTGTCKVSPDNLECLLHTHIPCDLFTRCCTIWCSSSEFRSVSCPDSILDLTDPSTNDLISSPSAAAVNCIREYEFNDRQSWSPSRQETNVRIEVFARVDKRCKKLTMSCRGCLSHSSRPSRMMYTRGRSCSRKQTRSTSSWVSGVRWPSLYARRIHGSISSGTRSSGISCFNMVPRIRSVCSVLWST